MTTTLSDAEIIERMGLLKHLINLRAVRLWKINRGYTGGTGSSEGTLEGGKDATGS